MCKINSQECCFQNYDNDVNSLRSTHAFTNKSLALLTGVLKGRSTMFGVKNLRTIVGLQLSISIYIHISL